MIIPEVLNDIHHMGLHIGDFNIFCEEDLRYELNIHVMISIQFTSSFRKLVVSSLFLILVTLAALSVTKLPTLQPQPEIGETVVIQDMTVGQVPETPVKRKPGRPAQVK